MSFVLANRSPRRTTGNGRTKHPRALKIGQSDGPSEFRADAFARASTGGAPDAVSDNRAARLQGTIAPGQVESLIDAARDESGSVSPVPSELRAGLGPAADQVRLHTGEAAGIAARTVGAQAFTLGRDVFFAPGKLRTKHPAGRALVAHELAHAVAPPSSNVISRTPGVAYSDEQTAALEAFKYLLAQHPDQLGNEWGGYLYKQGGEAGGESFFHSEARTDGNPDWVQSVTEDYARAARADEQAAWDRQPADAKTDPSKRPANFKPTPNWVEPESVQKRGGVLTATYHIHPNLGSSGNITSGQSSIEAPPTERNPYVLKWSGDIPEAHRRGLTSYMLDLAKIKPGKSISAGDLDVYVPNRRFPGLNDLVGFKDYVTNDYKCQWGFAPDGTPDTDGTKCARFAPNERAREIAAAEVESAEFAVAVKRGDIPQDTCLRMLAAADMEDEVTRCGIDPRSAEQRKLDEQRQATGMFDAWGREGLTAHSFLGPEDDPMRKPR